MICSLPQPHEPHLVFYEDTPFECPGTEEPKPEPIEYLVRLNLRELKKLEYLARKQRTTQAKRGRKGEVEMLEGIEEKLKRARLMI